MEILIFALIASYNVHRQQERVITEPEEFQPFPSSRRCDTLRATSQSGRRVGGRHMCHKPQTPDELSSSVTVTWQTTVEYGSRNQLKYAVLSGHTANVAV